MNRLIARYGADLTIIHDKHLGDDASFASAAKELGVASEVRVIDRHQTGHPTIGATNRELFLGGADMCLVIHKQARSCLKTLDCVRQAAEHLRLLDRQRCGYSEAG